MVVLVLLINFSSGNAKGFQFKASPASDLQGLFNEQQKGWLGADISTSIHFQDDKFLWLFGDTLVGKMVHQKGVWHRDIKQMPRNSIGIMTVDQNKLKRMEHYWRYNNTFPQHGGYFSPENSSHFFWPTSGIIIDSQLFVFAYDVYDTGNGMWGFAFNGTVCIHVADTTKDPNYWTYHLYQVPNTNNYFNLVSAIVLDTGVDDEDDPYVFIVGQSSGVNHTNSASLLARISVSLLKSFNWKAIEYWGMSSSGAEWMPYYDGIQLIPILDGKAPSECTVQYHDYLKQWYSILLDAFTTNIQISMAPNITGPWTPVQTIYNIPAPWNQSPIFCYATKSHPELQRSKNEIIFSFMSNTNWDSLPNELEVYVPQMIRVTIQ